jgi:hypothetical protein
VGEDRYRAVQQEAPWRAVDLRFEDGCVVMEGIKGCGEE